MIAGDRIKSARERLGLTQEQLGDLLGISKVSICGYEQGTRTPSLNIFLDLAQTLKVNIEYLLGDDIKVAEDKDLGVKIRKEDLQLLKELKTHKQLYDSLIKNPSQTLKLINKKLYD